jgi:putative nucleotidyltransferase with HDIG domain
MGEPTSLFVSPRQLRIGLHVYLDLPWTEHPFTFSSFRIKSLEQIETLQSLGLSRIRYSPARSDGEPLPAPLVDAPPPPAAPRDGPVYQAKRERIERLSAQRRRAAACEREFLSSARAMKSISQNLFAQPAAAREEATRLVQTMADSLLVEADIAIQLMKDKIGGDDVYFHSLNVALLSMTLAKELKAPPEAIRALGIGAVFHDVGKLNLPGRITRKLEPLTRQEMTALQQHCAFGLEIGRRLDLPAEAMSVIAQHHERVDGSGYPNGLKGAQMSLLAKIVAIANTFDNLCNPNNPARALTPHEALSVMWAQQRAHFEAVPLSTFVRCMGIYPPGTLVMLSNGVMGLVVAVNSTRPLKPTVLLYDADVPRDEAVLVDLEQEPEVSIARPLRPQELSVAAYEYLSPRRRTTYYFDASSSAQVR